MAGVVFDPSLYYTKTLMIFFIALIYSPGIPILYVFTFITFFLVYFIEKNLILK
jgi:hypothetical protein